jgi:hypothetical protein
MVKVQCIHCDSQISSRHKVCPECNGGDPEKVKAVKKNRRLELQLKLGKILAQRLREVLNNTYEEFYEEIEQEEDTTWDAAVHGALIDKAAEAENDLNACLDMLKKGKV